MRANTAAALSHPLSHPPAHPPTTPPQSLTTPSNSRQIVGNEVFEDGYVPVVCGLSRANEKDILRAWDAVKGAKVLTYAQAYSLYSTCTVRVHGCTGVLGS